MRSVWEVVGEHWTIHNTQTGDTTRGSTVSVPFTLYCPHIEHCRSITNICTEATLQYPHSIVVPVVHEDVGGPDGAGREPEVLHVTVLGLIPPQVVVRPLLKIATLQILVQF